ncbi:MAG: hypothetical protein WDM76_00395 [Limisphaerales bacterium]
MLGGFGGDCRKQRQNSLNPFGIECYHVNARFSKNIEDIGEFQGTKLLWILYYCLKAIWFRFHHGAENFYYVPAPGKRVALYRDWLVMLICRPFFKNIILLWHAAGLGKWLETSAQTRARAITYRLFKPVDLSVVLSRYNVADAGKTFVSPHLHCQQRHSRSLSGFCGNNFPAPPRPRRRAREIVQRRNSRCR